MAEHSPAGRCGRLLHNRHPEAALNRMTPDDYTFITLRGELRTKSDILKGFASGSFKYESRQISDLNVRVYRDTAVVTGHSVQKGLRIGRITAVRTGSHEFM